MKRWILIWACSLLALSASAQDDILARLKAEGVQVELCEAKPRKERPAGQRRVVRQVEQEGVCRLTWSNFKA